MKQVRTASPTDKGSPRLFGAYGLPIITMILPGLVWAYLDHRVWSWDQAQYGEVTLKFLGAFDVGFFDGLEAMGALLDYKAPGLTWLGVPYAALGMLLGRVEPALLGATLTWQLGTLLASYWSAYVVSRSRLTAFAVTAFIGSAPLFISMSHVYLVEPLQTFAVALAFLLALRAEKMSGEGIFVALCAVVALAMAAKTSSPLYCTLPLVYATSVLARRRSLTAMTAPRLVRSLLLMLAIISLTAVCWWYVSHFAATVENVRQATVGSVALNYGKQADFPTKLGYWISAFASAFLSRSPLLLPAAGIGALAGLALQTRGNHTTVDFRPTSAKTASWVSGIAALNLAIALTVYALQINDAPRFLEPLLPGTGIVLAWICGRRWLIVMPGALLGMAAVQYFIVYSYALAISKPTGVGHRHLEIVEQDDRQHRQMEEMVKLTCNTKEPYVMNVVGVDTVWLSHYSANFYAAIADRGRPGCRYTTLGYAPSDLSVALGTLYHVRHRYFITLRPEKIPSWPPFLNRVSAAVLREVEKSKEWEEYRTIDDTILIYRSRQIPANLGSKGEKVLDARRRT